MISQSTLWMTISDGVILLVATFSVAVLFSYRSAFRSLGIWPGILAISSGLILFSLFYTLDFFSLHLLPLSIGRGHAMQFVEDLHLHWGWLIATLCISSISLGTASVIHKLLHKQQELLRNKNSLAEAQRIGHMGNWDWNITANRLDWSDEIYRIFGLEPRAFSATYEAFLGWVHPEDREHVTRAVDRALQGEAPYDIEHRICLPDGRIRIVNEQAEVFRDVAGTPTRMVGTVQNVTEQRTVEQALHALAGIDSLADIQQFYRACISQLVQIYGVHFAFLGTFADPGKTRLQTQAFWVNDEFADDFEYTLKGTPCKDVLDGKIEFLTRGAAEKYPQFKLLTERGIDSYFGVPLVNTKGATMGIVAVFGTRPMKISPWTRPVLGIFARRIAAAMEHAEAETEKEKVLQNLRRTLTEKDVLLKEVHHRVKNNLQLISSLLRLQSCKLTHQEDKELFVQGLDRVQAVSLIHETIYRSEDLGKIHLPEYLKSLVRMLAHTHRTGDQEINTLIQAEDIQLPLEQAVPCALIISELVTNAYKHAFPEGRRGEIQVTATRMKSHMLLAVTDDGVGWQQALNIKNPSSLGMQLVTDLVRQLDGVMTVSNGEGLAFEIEIPLNNEA